MEETQETSVRESALEERERHDREIAEENKARQVRLGDVPEESEEETPKSKAGTRRKPTEE